MKLNSVEFYQSVRLWNNQEAKTLREIDLKGVEITLENHLVTLSHPDHKEIIVIPTANMRHGRSSKVEPFIVPEGVIDPNGVWVEDSEVTKTPNPEHPMLNMPKAKKVKANK